MTLLPLDPGLVCATPAAGALVLDTGVVTTHREMLKALAGKCQLLVSGVTYVELVHRYVDRNARGVVDALLRSLRIQVLPLEPDDVAAYALLQAELHALLVNQGTNSANAVRRVISRQHDLLIFASAIRRDLKVATLNTGDFEDFRPRHAWMTVAQVRSTHAV